MPKKQEKAVKQTEESAVENAVVEKEQKKSSGNTYEVAPMFKQYNSFLLSGGIVIPVQDGKVTVSSAELVSKLREGGFIK